MNEVSDSKFVTRKWSIVNDQWNTNYDAGKEIIYNTEVLNSNLSNNNDAYILVRGDIMVARNIAVRVVFKNCATFTTKLSALQKLMNNWCWRLKFGYGNVQFVRTQLELFWHDR